MSGRDEDAEIGGRTRDLLRALSDFADMVAVDAPISMLSRQLAVLEQIAHDVDALAETKLFENDVFGVIGDASKLMRLYEVLQHRQAQKSASE